VTSTDTVLVPVFPIDDMTTNWLRLCDSKEGHILTVSSERFCFVTSQRRH